MPDTSKASIVLNTLSPRITSYTFEGYSTTSVVDNVQLKMIDDAIATREYSVYKNDNNNSNKNLRSFMNDSRINTGIVDNQFISQFALDENYSSSNNNFNITEDLNDTDERNLEEEDNEMLTRDNTLIDILNEDIPNEIGSYLDQINQSNLMDIRS